MIAHVAEVENRTGLGDVCSQYHGGCLVKLKEGAPLVADRLPIAEQPIYYRYFGPIQTSEVLGNKEQTARINRAADVALNVLQTLTSAKPNPELFNACFAVSKRFSVESGLLSDVQVIDTIVQIEAEGGVASMIMLGNGVFSTHPFEEAVETKLVHNPARLIL
jgi:pantoate kinase